MVEVFSPLPPSPRFRSSAATSGHLHPSPLPMCFLRSGRYPALPSPPVRLITTLATVSPQLGSVSVPSSRRTTTVPHPPPITPSNAQPSTRITTLGASSSNASPAATASALLVSFATAHTSHTLVAAFADAAATAAAKAQPTAADLHASDQAAVPLVGAGMKQETSLGPSSSPG